jgi:hypothetical protein
VPKPLEPASPPPSPESAPSPSERDSSPALSTGSSPDAGSFIEDAGPEFDPEAAAEEMPPPPTAADRSLEAMVQWEEDTIAALLSLKGRGLHAAIGVTEEDWRYTELDLAAIAPPLTRICNRYEPIQRLAKYSDPMTLAFALGAYGVRSLEERQAELKRRALAYEEGGGDGTTVIPPADEPPVPPAAAPTPAPAPRQAASFPTSAPGPAPPMQPSEGPAPVGEPRPGEAPIDPAAVEWKVGG